MNNELSPTQVSPAVHARSAWLSRLYAAHRELPRNRYCPSCAHSLLFRSDGVLGTGTYVVREVCHVCKEETESRYPQVWVAKTSAEWYRRQRAEQHDRG